MRGDAEAITVRTAVRLALLLRPRTFQNIILLQLSIEVRGGGGLGEAARSSRGEERLAHGIARDQIMRHLPAKEIREGEHNIGGEGAVKQSGILG